MGRAVKVPQNLIGKPGTPVTIVHGGTHQATGTLKMESDYDGCIGVNFNWTGSLSTAPLIQYYWSPDETVFFEDKSVSPVTGPTGAAGTGGVDLGPYLPPKSAKAAKIVVTNKDVSIDLMVLAMGASIDYTIGTFGAAVGP